MSIPVVLPLWMTMHMTPWLVVTLIGNFLLDTVVLLVVLKAFQVPMKKDVKIRTVLMAWVFGFICDFVIVIIILILANSIPEFDIYDPYSHLSGIIVMIMMIIISMVLTFYMIRYLMNRVAVKANHAIQISIVMALCTVPYYILIPINITFDSFFI